MKGAYYIIFQQFKNDIGSINDIIYFDENDYLREKTSNPIKLKQVIIKAEELLEQLNEDHLKNKDEIYFLNGTLGNLYRIYGEPKNAIRYLQSNLLYCMEEKNDKKEVVTLIRLGEAYKYDNKHQEAMDQFDKALGKCKNAGTDTYFLDFVLQHKGKCLLELGMVEKALVCLENALEIRKLKGDSSLIQSTQQTINFGRKMKIRK